MCNQNIISNKFDLKQTIRVLHTSVNNFLFNLVVMFAYFLLSNLQQYTGFIQSDQFYYIPLCCCPLYHFKKFYWTWPGEASLTSFLLVSTDSWAMKYWVGKRGSRTVGWSSDLNPTKSWSQYCKTFFFVILVKLGRVCFIGKSFQYSLMITGKARILPQSFALRGYSLALPHKHYTGLEGLPGTNTFWPVRKLRL